MIRENGAMYTSDDSIFTATDRSLPLPSSVRQVVKWYKEHGLDAIPVHPKEDEVEGLHTVASIFDLTVSTLDV